MISTDDLLRVRSGDLTFDTFARESRADFMRLAYRLSATAPAWIDVEDIVQEMLLSVSPALADWREGDYPIKRFVVFRAMSAARRALKWARDYRRFETAVERLESTRESHEVQHTNAELRQQVLRRLDYLPQTPLQRIVMGSLARTQSMDRTAVELMRHPDTRVMFAADEDLVRIKIRRVMTILAKRAGDSDNQMVGV